MLMQGLELPDIRPCSSSQLLPPMTRPSSSPPPPLEPFLFEEPEDTYGQALVRTSGSTNSTMAIISASATDSTTEDSSRGVITTPSCELSSSNMSLPTSVTAGSSAPASPRVSRTTLWRWEKEMKRLASLGEDAPPPKKRKERNPYRCLKCGRPKAG